MGFEGKFHAKMILAKLALLWEGFWLAFAPAMLVAGLFLAYAGADLAAYFPGWPHLIVVVLLALLFLLALLWGSRRLVWPNNEAAERRLELDSEMLHRPLVALRDPLSGGGTNRETQVLWRVHRMRMALAIQNLKVGLPRPGLPAKDPYALRAGVFLLLAISLISAGGEFGPRLAQALSPTIPGEPVPAIKVEAWVNPPAYTGLAPLHLTAAAGKAAIEELVVPVNSELFVRLYGGRGDAVLVIAEAENKPFKRVDALNNELEMVLTEGSALTIQQGTAERAHWPLRLVPDQTPTVRLITPPGQSVRGALKLDVEANDDYGLAGLRLKIDLNEGDQALKSPLGALNNFALALTFRENSDGQKDLAETYYNDLTGHPWAGLQVNLHLEAEDYAEQIGQSAVVSILLPERNFRHPVARAMIEQRKQLTRNPRRRDRVARALAAIRQVPAAFDHDFTVVLGLASVVARLRYDKSIAAAVSSRRLLWDLALRVEDGKLSLAERRLRQAEDALMDALARDASDEEIARLTEELSRAMNDFLQAMTEEAMKRAQEGEIGQEMDSKAQQIRREELQDMLRRMQELSKLGAKDAAMEMLRQMRAMLENLQSNPQFGQNNSQNQMNEATRQLNEMMRQQQELMDKTLQGNRQRPSNGGRMQQGRRNPGQQQGQPGQQPSQQGEPSAESLARQQEALRKQLGELMRRLGEGAGQIPDPLGKAERAMRDARESLQGGNNNQAMSSQGQAIDQLAKGIRSIMTQGAGEQGEEGQGSAGNNTGEDPSGRPRQSGGLDSSFVRIPTESEVQRARQILNELRKRAGERERPKLELNYIDRLIQPF